MSPQKYWNKIYRFAAPAVLLMALAGVAFVSWPKVAQFRSYQETKSGLIAEIGADNERINELRLKQEKFRTDKHFVQKIAHEIGFAHEGETIFQFEDPSATSTSAPSNP